MTLSYSTPTLTVAGLSLAWKLYDWYRKRQENPQNLPLPPGPKGYPLVDNLFDLPTEKPWVTYDEWSKVYGDMVYFKVFGQPFLILGSIEKANEIFEKRSSNYSSRPRGPMLTEVMGMTYFLAFMPYGERWRGTRRTFHDHFHQNVVHQYDSVQEETSREFLRRLLKSPEDFVRHIRYSFSSTIMKITYGISTNDDDDPLLVAAETTMAGVAAAGRSGEFLVDLFPVMQYIPSWFPGAGWKKKALYWRDVGEMFLNKPFEITQERVKNGSATPSMAATLVEKLSDESCTDRAQEEAKFRSACATAFAGGADTTTSTIHALFMAMCLYPEVQKKAQAELDRVLGGRLPEFNDRPNLPYVAAIAKESLRWQLVGPLGVPRVATEADEYNGFYIPKGTIVMGNLWAMCHDPEIYPEPFRFNPDRFLKDGKFDPSVRDPNSISFGFGRRICPGRFLSEKSLFILTAHLLTVFDVRPALGKDGKEVGIQPEMTPGLISFPKPFECRITPRSIKAEELIRNSDLMG